MKGKITVNYYQILGVKQSATQEEIKSAYISLVKKYHPDIYKGDKTYAENKTKEINNAYDTLSNPDLKAKYDLEINPPKTSYENTSYTSYTRNTYNSSNQSSYYNRGNGYYSNPYTQDQFSHYNSTINEKIYNLHFKKTSTIVLTFLFVYLGFSLLFLLDLYKFCTSETVENTYDNPVIDDSYVNNTTTTSPQNDINYYEVFPFLHNNHKTDNDDIYNYFSEDVLESAYDKYYYKTYDSYDDFINELYNRIQENQSYF